MTELEKILLASVIAFIFWIVQKVSIYLVVKDRVAKGLLTEIRSNIREIKEAKNYLKKLREQYLIEGNRLGYLDKFTKTENSFYKSQTHELPKYFGSENLEKITIFFTCFWELQILIEGFLRYLENLSENDAELSAENIIRADRKLDRIFTLSDLITDNKIMSLGDLKNDYKKRLSPESMI